MGFITKLFYFFSSYTDADERAVGIFFKRLTEHSNQTHIRTHLGALLQRNIAVVNLWSEYRYKGYRYLRKARRKQLYANLQLIAQDFDRYYRANPPTAEGVVTHVRRIAPPAVVEPPKVILLQALMGYFSSGQGTFLYRESSSFGRLLRDPTHEKLVGDCNQIVTLYIYLYARYYDAHDLQVRVMPGHVALHYAGVDIETTNGTFTNYAAKPDTALLPVEEIVSINLLDTTDSYLARHEVSAHDLLQASRLAYLLSHNRDIVTRNLRAAYNRLVNTLMQQHNYAKALKFATASRDASLIGLVGHNGAVYEMNRHNYSAARRFARHASERDTLIRSTWQAEGGYHYRAQRYHDAIKAFKHVNDQKLVRQCYEALFFEEQKKLGPNLTTVSIKQYANPISRMHTYAKKSGNQKLVAYANNLRKHL